MTLEKKLDFEPNVLTQPTKHVIVEKALALIQGERRQEYGPVDESTKRLAMAITAYLLPKLKPDCTVTPLDYVMINVIEKALREGILHKEDNLVDIIGYTMIAETVTTLK